MSLPLSPHRVAFGLHAPSDVAAARSQSVVAIVPTRDEADSIAPIVRVLVELRDQGVIDRVVVADDSSDDTPKLAQQAGAEVVRQADLDPGVGAVRGKGDAMWRALGVAHEDVVCFVDGDTEGFGPQHVVGLVGAVAVDGHAFAKGRYRRPFVDVRGARPTGGGRVTELTAKPLLRQLFPQLLAFEQPLAGELAARTDVLRSLPIATGYAVDVALLIDAWRELGLDAMAEVDLGERQNRHRPLAELAAMADEVATAILARAGLLGDDALTERPPRVPAALRSPLGS
ncbi:MAG: glucosyl-3-phosphoglycerate synthase [Solirubrobacteraceae bacterium]|nr:glucosyl-3-phosphoglycerate synthase [Solirubrobacteraceae bacterium]